MLNMKHLTLAEFIQWCKDNGEMRFYNAAKDIQDSVWLWMCSIEANSNTIRYSADQALRRYNQLVEMFGPEIDQDLQHFYNDNKD